ncbi:MAG: vitamin K epoxide reductase family protein [Chthoniobacterales bacterium]
MSAVFRASTLYAAAAIIALVGLGDAIYLTVEHLTGNDVVCLASASCGEVLGSRFATIGWMPLAGLGAVAYFAAFSCATLAAFGNRRAENVMAVVVAAMFLATLWLLFVQAFLLHAFCDYCLLSAALTTFLAVIAGVMFFRRRREAIFARSINAANQSRIRTL